MFVQFGRKVFSRSQQGNLNISEKFSLPCWSWGIPCTCPGNSRYSQTESRVLLCLFDSHSAKECRPLRFCPEGANNIWRWPLTLEKLVQSPSSPPKSFHNSSWIQSFWLLICSSSKTYALCLSSKGSIRILANWRIHSTFFIEQTQSHILW